MYNMAKLACASESEDYHVRLNCVKNGLVASEESPQEECVWTDEASSDLRVEFFEPADYWTEALPVGNGRLGAMIWGGVASELLQLNEETLWSGGPKNWNNAEAAKLLPQVRELVWESKFVEATEVATKMLGPRAQVYQPLCDINLDFGETHNAYDKDSYYRDLNLDLAMASVTYKVNGIQFNRDTFSSHPHQVISTRITASQLGSVAFTVALTCQLPYKVQVIEPNKIVLHGNCPGNLIPSSNLNAKHGMEFAAALEVHLEGGSGVIKSVDNMTLTVENADSAILYLAAGSSFDGPFNDPTVSGKDPIKYSLNVLNRIRGLSYEHILESHIRDYQALFHRVHLQLSKNSMPTFSIDRTSNETLCFKNGNMNLENVHGGVEKFWDWQRQKEYALKDVHQGYFYRRERITRNHRAKVSTRERVKLFSENEDPGLVVLLFQFGRYLLISSSRPGTFVSNLQGIWNKELMPPWSCAPHTNINLQMNYWPAETCNLSECQQPLFDLISWIAVTGKTTAEVNYRKKGWTAHHVIDIWAQTAPAGTDPRYGLWPMSGAWLCTHLWEHYSFSLDKDFLQNVAFPLMKGSVEFLLDWLLEDSNGNLVTNPATSPEHEFIAPDGKLASVSYATAMDMAITRELFSDFISAAEIIKYQDSEFIKKVKDAKQRLFPQKIGSDGLIMEWALEFKDPEIHHRHLSHLFGLYPGHSLTLQKTPSFCEAAARSIIKRGEDGPGWSTAWKTLLWARLWNSEHAYRMVKKMFTLIDDTDTAVLSGGGLYGNLFCAHPPFQIDGNFGFAAAIAEMLVQTDESNIYLLPALPKDKWPNGSVSGLRGRNNITLAISWQENDLYQVTLIAGNSQSCPQTMHYRNKSVILQPLCVGCVYTFDNALNAVGSQSFHNIH